jgi:hypothetical protein
LATASLDFPTIPNAPVMSVKTPTLTGSAFSAGAAVSLPPDVHAVSINTAANDVAIAALRRKRTFLNLLIYFSFFFCL